jgi:DNA-binding NtrC family response regulator
MEIASVLTTARFDVVACSTAAEALALLKLVPSRALVVDHDLADMGGVDFIRVCANEGLSPVTIMTTNKGEISAAVQALREGISDFLPEPYDHRLAQSLRRALGEAGGQDSVNDVARGSDPPA